MKKRPEMQPAALILALILIPACSPAHRQQPAAARLDPARHAVFVEQLRELMGDLNSLMLSEKEMTEHERGNRQRKYRLVMAGTAKAMGQTVEAILARLPALKLNPTDQAAFTALAGQLQAETRSLEDLAGNASSKNLSSHLDRMEATCKACHQLFRTTGY